MQTLITALLDLAHRLPQPNPFLVGGGFGLYIKQLSLQAQADLETLLPGEAWPPPRATEDIDLLLPAEVITDAARTNDIEAAFKQLGYAPKVPHFQFVKELPPGQVRIDLLTCDVAQDDLDKVKINPPRVRPRGGGNLHAHLVREALELDLAPFETVLRGHRSDGSPAKLPVRVPNPFTYLLMKLHAFRDRVGDERRELADHHAIDAYRIVAMLTRDEYDMVRALARRHDATAAVRAARAVIEEFFGAPSAVGMRRLAAAGRAARLPDHALQSEEFRRALAELLADEP
jgi:hypothetical protein